MESRLKQNRIQKKGNKFITVQEWELKQKQKLEICNWLDLPSDLMSMILMRLNAVDILRTAQFVCSSWYRICIDPLMWKSIHIDRRDSSFYSTKTLRKVMKIAVDRSCGQLVDISIELVVICSEWCNTNDDLLEYIIDRSPQLTRIRFPQLMSHLWFNKNISEGLSEALLKLPLLTYIDISPRSISESTIEAIGLRCPLLKSFLCNDVIEVFACCKKENKFKPEVNHFDVEAFAIAANMSGLQHLTLVGRRLSDVGLRAILDGCSHLASLDVRSCHNINLAGDLGKICSDQIKDLRGPSDSTSHYEYVRKLLHYPVFEDGRYALCGQYL